MALVKGTNCCFVTVAPVADPEHSNSACDTMAKALKDTSPAGNYKVTEIGWWCDNATQEADFDVGIYSHDAGNDRPLTLLGSSVNNAKGTGAGWKVVSGLNISLTASTIYWIAFQLDDTATATNFNYGGAGSKYATRTTQTSLPASWGVSDSDAAVIVSIYALIEEIKIAGGFSGFSPWIFMKDMWEEHNKIWQPNKKILIPQGI